jgi:serine/threonine-protein kinase
VGKILEGHYRVEDRLGHGAMGIVFRAQDLMLDRVVAIKLIDEQTNLDGAARRFQREARTLARVRHDNVVQIFACGGWEEHQYIVMEYIDGR